ncbi:MAG: hypothetical protein H6631_06450 [Anaerolineaceae bacterium]|nr:hypothetical protein [Anaerolineaceae bacterium]MCB9101795.1 hypothetical protein [Anaerolineales bacterium]
MTRTSLVITGLVGVAGAVGLTAVCMLVVIWGWLPVFLDNPLLTWSLFSLLLFFSLAEIPVMVYAMRRMAAGGNPRAKYLIWLTNTGYTFFAGIYAMPFILLAGSAPLPLAAGALLGLLALVRFISTLIFLPGDKPYEL